MEQEQMISGMAATLESMIRVIIVPDKDEDGGARRCVISKVAEEARKVAPEEYNPKAVVIGPYNQQFRTRYYWKQQEKCRFLKKALSISEKKGVELKHILKELVSLDQRARSCYVDTFEMTTEEFVQMLLLDGCYILLSFNVVDAEESSGRSSTEGGALQTELDDEVMVHDAFCLVENQIPFFVLEKIYELITKQNPQDIVDKFAEYIKSWMEKMCYTREMVVTENQPRHLLHLAHTCFRPPERTSAETRTRETVPRQGHTSPGTWRPRIVTKSSKASRAVGGWCKEAGRAVGGWCNDAGTEVGGWCSTAGSAVGKWCLTAGRWRNVPSRWPSVPGRWHRATEYQMAGVTFKNREFERVHCILDVWIDGGTVEVPCLTVDKITCMVLRNMMFLEQHNPWLGSHVTAYCCFLSQVACTADDVALLSRKGIIVHHLGSDDELAKCFAHLCTETYFVVDDSSRNYLRPVWEAMERRYQSPVCSWVAWLRQNYFRNPWLALGLLAAFVGLVCAVLQTVFTVLGYKSGPN